MSGTRGFDLLGPLPDGTTVLEASAGTGKTFAIVGLALRFVAEAGIDLSQLLLITFSRAATHELRERTRDRFVSAAVALGDPAKARVCSDELIRHLADADAEEVSRRRHRLLQAQSDFDAATIVTTHSFCQRVLDGLGTAGERDPDAVLVEAADDLVMEVIDDLYLRAYSRVDVAPFTLAEATEAARAAIFDPQAVLAPEDAHGTSAGARVAFAEAVRAEVERRKRAVGLRDFDDLPMLLHRVLADPEHGEEACRRVRERYRAVLVDEFQDTDPLQWDILRLTFHGQRTLVLVGDPKQAIYAFRGAEVLSYLEAVKSADHHHELGTNWRSDQELLGGLDYLYGGAALGHPGIVVHEVDAPDDRQKSRLAGSAPLRVRYLPRTGAGPLNKSGYPAVGPLRERVAADLAADIVRLLGAGATIDISGETRLVEPGDIAVLVRTNAQTALVYDALTRLGVPSVLAGGASVFTTPAAQHWLWILQAIEQPHRSDRVRLAALTPLLGRRPEELADSGSGDIVAEIGASLRELGSVFVRSGFAALFERLPGAGTLEERLLGTAAGERVLTDLRHVAELLNAAAVEESLGLTALSRWLTERIKDPSSGGVDRSRRLDSDAAAVQIGTVHASKGLEFPLVYLPYAWDAAKASKPSKLLLHDDRGRRILDVGGADGAGYSERRRRHDEEEAGEELRLLYVALTRAMCGLVVWWAPAITTSGAPLHRMIFGRQPGSRDVPQRVGVPEDPVVAERLAAWGRTGPEAVRVEAVGSEPIDGTQWAPERGPSEELKAASFERKLDLRWRRTSYSALTASAHEASSVGSEAEVEEKADEPAEPPLSVPTDDVAGVPSTMNGFAGGAAFGTLVHAVLEVIDTSASDLEAEVVERCRTVTASVLSEADPEHLAEALLPVLRTPLGPGTDRTLADIATTDRLAELEFELPLVGGDTPSPTVTLGEIGILLGRHLPSEDPLQPYAQAVQDLESTELRGYLTGSIDAVLRLPGPRYVVVDYKTNKLAEGDELTTAHYTREAMAAEMLRAHYPLQALLYSVALHRYLRWRQPGYDPAEHLGGVQYLFVRGMVGAETPTGCGVFDWSPPAALITELSDLLSGAVSHQKGAP
ncbi:UvrD-helicase domain-containing protein [Rhodococcus sp. WMMA185]|uniref:UvrD-helicase domain-containing protein n=1 Tax=Rhodococcus sp. WMMA185 TaxID=679318 RepID=UPI000A5A86BE|nr:UvrD-helicase domain-containing protein [Rhodococcus sp. WMMA185]